MQMKFPPPMQELSKLGREIQADVTSLFEETSEEFDSCRLSGDHDRMHVGLLRQLDDCSRVYECM
jgi:hypothetical protein